MHHHPLLASVNLRYALTAVPGLASQTAIPARAVHSMQVGGGGGVGGWGGRWRESEVTAACLFGWAPQGRELPHSELAPPAVCPASCACPLPQLPPHSDTG